MSNVFLFFEVWNIHVIIICFLTSAEGRVGQGGRLSSDYRFFLLNSVPLAKIKAMVVVHLFSSFKDNFDDLQNNRNNLLVHLNTTYYAAGVSDFWQVIHNGLWYRAIL